MCQVWFHAFSVKSDQGSQMWPKGIAVYVNFSIPHPLSSRNLKKALKLPPHRYLPTPTTFHFLPPPYIFVPISPSSLLCTSPFWPESPKQETTSLTEGLPKFTINKK